MYLKHFCRKSLKRRVDTLQREIFFQSLGSTPGLSPEMETSCWFHSCFWHYFQRHALIQSFTTKSKTRIQHNLIWGTVYRVNWYELFSVNGFIWWKWLIFFIVVNYLWTDCDHTNRLLFKKVLHTQTVFQTETSCQLAVHINYSHYNWHFPSVLLKHHLMHPCKFHSRSFLWIHIHCNILCVNFYMYE